MLPSSPHRQKCSQCGWQGIVLSNEEARSRDFPELFWTYFVNGNRLTCLFRVCWGVRGAFFRCVRDPLLTTPSGRLENISKIVWLIIFAAAKFFNFKNNPGRRL
jgi:hypothetical protein